MFSVTQSYRSRVFSFKLQKPPAHLVLDSRLEVSQKGVGFSVLQLPVLHRPTTQEVIQLRGKDSDGSAFIL